MIEEEKVERLRLLQEVDIILESCEGCPTRTHFNRLRDATGLIDACRECPTFIEASQYGDKFLELTRKRKRNSSRAKESID